MYAVYSAGLRLSINASLARENGRKSNTALIPAPRKELRGQSQLDDLI